ncbi:hypothetical protein BKA56DRAFT_659998 [Ilyonectria sp. MPI-CAGE-AT-0026]|nr:hypothetical protein BKA56DRAFT_659998 [Ilyonectria sp. MPI-CAGE-AT-0026]
MSDRETGGESAGQPPSETEHARQPPKRVMTAARKEQNRVAQKAYRQRQRERRQTLRADARKWGQTLPVLRPREETGPDICQFRVEGQSDITREAGPLKNQALTCHSDGQRQDTNQANLRSSPGPNLNGRCTELSVQSKALTSIELQPLPDLTYPSGDLISFCAAQLLAGSSSHCSATTTNDDVWATDVTPMDAGALSLSGTVSSEVSPLLPCLRRNSLRLVPTFIVSAVFENALSLDYDLARLAECRGDYISPFYEPLASPQNDPEVLIASAIERVSSSSCNRTIPVHLRPTLAQILIPHDASLDLIPLPFLRERAIMLAAVMPETFNMWELKFDIYHRGGLIIWQQDRSGQEGSSTCTSYQPWDMRSWEATPWFLQKWCMVVGGKDSPFWKQSTWWHSLRGVEHG